MEARKKLAAREGGYRLGSEDNRGVKRSSTEGDIYDGSSDVGRDYFWQQQIAEQARQGGGAV